MESESSLNPPESSAKMRLAEGQEVNLGCGTLILIALIVLIFSRSKTGDLEREIEGLRTEIRELKTAVEGQSVRLQELQNTLTKPKAE
ncbi:hypothetical protein [Pirellula sp. SH-Sr6A]|uniref:hypothetical protein n=1 Tax=Pirellula sp. SH-Sr6A TaxID=1632865 RepID=UPI0011BA4EE5|nr:hypothetical protein [Pirellula sp. SH-Sr6A]